MENDRIHYEDMYAYQALLEIVLAVKEKLIEERGKFSIPQSFMDALLVTCKDAMLEKGEGFAREKVEEKILEYLKNREEERKKFTERKLERYKKVDRG
ncbi:MAG: hypothetical protein AB1779_04520 [Candidatus Thermoplasmatota archaeon]